MPENKTDKMCPVQSFHKYISHLNPNSDYMWQYPLEKINPEHPDVWYSRKHVGKNPLATFMSDLSRDAKLSKIYTNHCIRATGITILTDAKFSNADIMSVSGHKSVQSLSVYQKMDEKKKIEMGEALTKSMKKQEQQAAIAAPPKQLAIEGIANKSDQIMRIESEYAVTPKQNVSTAIVPFEAEFEQEGDIPDIDLLKAICDMEDMDTMKNSTVKTTVANTSNVFNQIPQSLFAHCKIGTVNLNLVQK